MATDVPQSAAGDCKATSMGTALFVASILCADRFQHTIRSTDHCQHTNGVQALVWSHKTHWIGSTCQQSIVLTQNCPVLTQNCSTPATTDCHSSCRNCRACHTGNTALVECCRCNHSYLPNMQKHQTSGYMRWRFGSGMPLPLRPRLTKAAGPTTVLHGPGCNESVLGQLMRSVAVGDEPVTARPTGETWIMKTARHELVFL